MVVQQVGTPRLTMNVRLKGQGTPVLFIHGNASSSIFWDEVLEHMPENYYCIAPDLRGYGDTEDKTIDATRGVGDWVEDVQSLLSTLGVEKYHVVGHSLGGAVLWGMLAADSDNILTATAVAPGSPFGFGGTKDVYGTPCYPDFAGSGGGTVNPEFTRLIAAGDRSSDSQTSPRVVMNAFYFKPPFKPEREEDLLSGVLSEKIGTDKYPGDFVTSPNWPYIAPGVYGPANALSPKYVGDTVQKMLSAQHKPKVLWIYGDSDQIVSDTSLFEFGTLGKLGAVAGYPGEEVYPSQPMLGQTRHVLQQYGNFSEVVMPNVGHTPFVENLQEFMLRFTTHLSAPANGQ